MTINNEDDIKKIEIDTIFFFLLTISSLISFYIITEKKNILINQSKLSSSNLNQLFRFNRKFIFLIDIYFLINAYLSLKNNNNNEEENEEIKYLLLGSLFSVIGAFFFLFVKNTLVIEDE